MTKREMHITAATNAYRIVYGEADGLPGIIIDTYDGVVVLKLYSGIWLPFLEDVVNALVNQVAPKCIVLRLSRIVSKNRPELENGTTLYGTLADPLVVFKEFEVLFQAHVVNGHKTGYFLDHRANRHRVGTMANNKEVLDVFSYAGGFSVHALVGGAKSVTSVDISAQALQVARENASLNTFNGTHQIVQGDAFDVLQQMVADGLQFDLVVIDPPSFAKQKSEVDRALKQYQKLAQLGAQLTKKGGILVLASCSSRIDVPAFEQAHQRGFKKAGVPAKKQLLTQHDWDHIASIPELAYLKTIYYQL
jgi:23S rRNA (cytosine1962-C5)-methyltransferase